MQDGLVSRILVVDDEPSVLETIAAILQREGYDVEAVDDVDDALGRLEQSSFDVVLTDLRLEGASGLHILSELHKSWPETTAIVLTGYASLQSAIDALREGVYDYLVKPCNVAELKATVARAVERGRLTRELRDRLRELDTANAKLTSFNEELQRRVDQATADLNHSIKELGDAKRRLEEANAQREEFISMIAHELGQPLTMISGYAQLLGRPNVSAEMYERARSTIVSQTRRLARLVQDLADASHLAAGHFTINRSECDLVGIVQELVESARANDGIHNVSIGMPAEPLSVIADRDRLTQVLSNLLNNAIKYTEGGDINVTLTRDDVWAVVEVRDHGAGIPEDRLEAIFEPRVRLVDESGQRPDGAGLGLYIARGIVEAHGGRLEAANAVDGGAVFRIRIPMP